jgi:hypothetical protein
MAVDREGVARGGAAGQKRSRLWEVCGEESSARRHPTAPARPDPPPPPPPPPQATGPSRESTRPCPTAAPWAPGPGPTSQGFALFSCPAAARLAVDLVSGSQFDEGAMLRAEMARKNMYLKVGARGMRGGLGLQVGLGPRV